MRIWQAEGWAPLSGHPRILNIGSLHSSITTVRQFADTTEKAAKGEGKVFFPLTIPSFPSALPISIILKAHHAEMVVDIFLKRGRCRMRK